MGGYTNLFTFSRILIEEPCSRNVVENRLHRNPIRCVIFRMLFKQLESLYINTPPERIEGGLSFQHGFSTVVAAKHIGKNCRIFQQVTIGFNGAEQPILEDRVEVCAGAKDIEKLGLDYVVVGSDEVWNYRETKGNARVKFGISNFTLMKKQWIL